MQRPLKTAHSNDTGHDSPRCSADRPSDGQSGQVEQRDRDADAGADPGDLGVVDDLTVAERDIKVVRLAGE